MSLRMSVAARLSVLGGDLSIMSSVMLKSPSRKSGRGRCAVLLAVSTSAQKAGCHGSKGPWLEVSFPKFLSQVSHDHVMFPGQCSRDTFKSR